MYIYVYVYVLGFSAWEFLDIPFHSDGRCLRGINLGLSTKHHIVLGNLARSFDIDFGILGLRFRV